MTMATKRQPSPDTAIRSPLIDKRTLCRDYHLSASSVFRCVANGMLPAPVRSGPGPTSKRYWFRAEVEAAIQNWPRDAGAAA